MIGKANFKLRWIALLVVLINVVFNGVYSRIPGMRDINAITRSVEELFAPPGYVFAIWGLIYLSFVIYCLFQLFSESRPEPIFDKLSVPLIAANLLCSAWILLFSTGLISLSLVVILVILALAAYMYVTAKHEQDDEEMSWMLVFPFSLFFGWLSVAALANVSLWLRFTNLVSVEHAGTLAQILLIVAMLLAVVIGLYYRNSVYTIVIAWAALGIALIRRSDHPELSQTGVFVTLICAGVLIINIIRYFRR